MLQIALGEALRLRLGSPCLAGYGGSYQSIRRYTADQCG